MKSIKLIICFVCLSLVLSACAIPRPTFPDRKDIPVCKIEEKGEQILAFNKLNG